MTDNILIFMVDQLNDTHFPDGPAEWLHAPNLKLQAARSTRFTRAYTASPLCAPGRASFMPGELPSATRVYDNAAEFVSSIPTYAHHLCGAGYQTCLVGKMHFVGPDQLHGFEQRLTTDIYTADFGWTPDYRQVGDRIDWWYYNMGSVTGADVGVTSNQLEYDDEVAHQATGKLYDLACGDESRPWCLTVSFTHPHDPYVARKKYWHFYADCAHLLPEVSTFPYAEQDVHSRRIFDANDWRTYEITEDQIKASRREYFANISYLYDKIGEVLEVLETTGQEATILFVCDHGDMLGERGLWFKMSFYEGSARVPLMDASPNLAPGAVTTPVSTIDVCPTLCDLAGVSMAEVMPWTSGESLLPLAAGGTRSKPVAMEYAAEASYAPRVSLCSDRWKYTRCVLDPEQLFDLEADPNELINLASNTQYGEVFIRSARTIPSALGARSVRCRCPRESGPSPGGV